MTRDQLRARLSGHSPSRVLMPLSFAALLGGLITLIGTSPNIVVSRLRQELVGQPFTMFDFAPVGIGITLVGLVFLALGWRLLPEKAAAHTDRPFEIADYSTEVRVSESSDALPPSSDFEMPKSNTFTMRVPSARLAMNRLAGFKSRCTMPAA
jgi:di/tricarboxylate transporter